MCEKWYSVLVALLLSTMISSNAFAQTVQAEQQKLVNAEARLSTLQAQQVQLQKDIKAKQAAIDKASNAPSPEKDKLDDAHLVAQQAAAAYKAEPSATNKSKKSNADFKVALAERKYLKSNSELTQLERDNTALKNQQSDNAAEISALTTQIPQQQQQLAELKTRQLETQQQLQRDAEQERIRAEHARTEAARAQAVLAEQETKQRAAATAALAIANKKALEKQQAEEASSSLLLSDPPAIAAAEKRLSEALAGPGSTDQYNKILNIKPILADGKHGTVTSRTLRSLGKNQYRGATQLEKGDVIFVVGFYKWEQTIAKAGKYTFLYDATDAKKPRLVYFEQNQN